MVVKRYALRTMSASHYLLERHTSILGNNYWLIYQEGIPYYVNYLINTGVITSRITKEDSEKGSEGQTQALMLISQEADLLINKGEILSFESINSIEVFKHRRVFASLKKKLKAEKMGKKMSRLLTSQVVDYFEMK